TYDVKPETLEPARKAHDLVLPLLEGKGAHTDTDTRIRIAKGFGTILDPRLQAGSPERWVLVPAGPFFRGSEAEDSWIQERPQSKIYVSKYWIQRWPVTVVEYRRFMEEGGYESNEWWGHDEGRHWRDANCIREPKGWLQQRLKGNCPVTGICWWEA